MFKDRGILIVDDDIAILESLARILTREGYAVSTAENGEQALETVRQGQVSLALTDLKMPRMDGMQLLKAIKMLAPDIEVIVMTGFAEVDTAVEAMREGAYHFIQKPLKRAAILLTVERALEKRALVLENRSYREQLEGEQHFSKIIGKSPVMRELITKVQQVAPSSANILIIGESGTGKEVFADTLHAISPRNNRPMVKVNCAALPDTLLESELFGYEKGAFTGATTRKLGRFDLADGGTLFLDEIGDMPKHLQVKLLRVLQEGEFDRLGGIKTVRVDARIIAASNKDLRLEVERGNFREDLFYRLNVITLRLPPLHERKADIPLLVSSFLKTYSEKNGKTIREISREALNALTAYDWPGNVRELENVIEQAVVLTKSETITLADLPSSIQPGETQSHASVVVPIGMPMEEVERLVIAETLKATGGDKLLTASLLGISSRTIYRKLGD